MIIPCYNQAHYLNEAIESALNQTYKNFEVVIVNDGSTDNIEEVLRKYRDNPLVSVIHQSNQGLARARNNGIKKARGDCILPLDADDRIRETMLEKTVPLLDADPKLGIVYTHFQFFGDIDQLVEQIDYDFMVLAYHANYMTCCSLLRKKAWEEAGGYNPNMKYGYEDWDLWIGMGERGWYGKLVPEPLFLYRQSGASMRTDTHQHLLETYQQIIKNHPLTYKKPLSETKWFDLKRKIENENRFPIGNATFPAFQYLVDNIVFKKIENPKVSVIITCGPENQFLEDTIKSVLFQTYRSFEVIIPNLGAKGKTRDTLQKYKNNARIVIMHQNNRDLYVARNEAISKARGEYILVLDADDIIHERMLEKTVSVLEADPRLGVAYTHTYLFGRQNLAIDSFEYNLELLKQQNFISRSSLFRKEAWSKAGGYTADSSVEDKDWKLWIDMGRHGWYGKLIPEPLFFYRV